MKAALRVNDGLNSGQSVLFLSFSRAAVARLGEAAKKQIERSCRHRLSMQTLHSFFWSVLSTHGYLIGTTKKLEILLPADEQTKYGSIKKKNRKPSNPEWKSWLKERERLCMEEGRVAFDLFAENTLKLLRSSDQVRRLVSQKYPLIIIDEAQDTNSEAWECIQLLAKRSQVICLADLEQQIFDHLPGVGPERVKAIESSINPLRIDLGDENYRSNGTEIARFGQDILLGDVRGSPYRGVSALFYNPKTTKIQSVLKRSIGILQNEIKNATGKYGRDIAILAHSGASTAKISAALHSEPKPVSHRLSFDEGAAILTARFAAFLLEPKEKKNKLKDLSTAISLIAMVKRAGGLAAASGFELWSENALTGKVSKSGFVTSLSKILDGLADHSFSGDPVRDWNYIKNVLRSSKDKELLGTLKHLDYLIAFNRGKLIREGLGTAWMNSGNYSDARGVLDTALAQDQILNGIDEPPGVKVMTIHKSKGKQFDGVILLREGRHDEGGYKSSFVWWNDTHPYFRSRKILRVGITRAKTHTLIVNPAFPHCPILSGHNLS